MRTPHQVRRPTRLSAVRRGARKISAEWIPNTKQGNTTRPTNIRWRQRDVSTTAPTAAEQRPSQVLPQGSEAVCGHRAPSQTGRSLHPCFARFWFTANHGNDFSRRQDLSAPRPGTDRRRAVASRLFDKARLRRRKFDTSILPHGQRRLERWGITQARTRPFKPTRRRSLYQWF